MSTDIDDNNYTKFIKHLDASHDTSWIIGRWLFNKGYTVKMNAAPVMKKGDDPKKFADQGDIEISQRVEVKQLSAKFAGRHNWPFHEEIIVCAKHSYDDSIPKPFVYIYVSDDQEAVAMIMADTRAKWYEKPLPDRRYKDYTQVFYCAHVSLAKFMSMKELLEGK